MGKLIDWALAQIDHMPAVPAPFLIAFLIVLVIVFPTIKRAWTTKVEAPAITPNEALPTVTLNASGIYTVLINIEIQMRTLTERIEEIERQLLERQMPRRERRRRLKMPKRDREPEAT